MKERICQFGDNRRLLGILTPAQIGEASKTRARAVLILNAGLVHRVGPHRLHVKLARHLAAAGYDVLRFDLSGLGDSRPAPAGLGYAAQAVSDVRAALDLMNREAGHLHAAAIGICAGADNAYRAALADTRLDALAMIDPFAYPNRDAAMRFQAERLGDATRWQRLALRSLGFDQPSAMSAPAAHLGTARVEAPLEQFGQDLATLTGRGVHVRMIYTRFNRQHVSRSAHVRQTFAAFDLHDRLSARAFPQHGHTFDRLDAQAELFDDLGNWLTGLPDPVT